MQLRPSLPIAAAVAVASLLAACADDDGGGGVASLEDGDGGSGSATATTLSDEEAQELLIDWVECMRGEGIDLPDPQVAEDGGMAIRIGRSERDGGSDDGASEPLDRDTIRAAQDECGEPPRTGGEFTEEDRREMEERSLAFAECMRENGIDDFPDPDFSAEGPGAGAVTRQANPRDRGDRGGPMIAGPFGEVDLADPEVAAAFEVCRAELGDQFGAPGMAAEPAR